MKICKTADAIFGWVQLQRIPRASQPVARYVMVDSLQPAVSVSRLLWATLYEIHEYIGI